MRNENPIYETITAMYERGTKICITKATQGQLVLYKHAQGPYAGRVVALIVGHRTFQRVIMIKCSDVLNGTYTVPPETMVVPLIVVPQLEHIDLGEDEDTGIAVATSASSDVDATSHVPAVTRLPTRLYGVLRQHARMRRTSVTESERNLLQSLDLNLNIYGQFFGGRNVQRRYSIEPPKDLLVLRPVIRLLTEHGELKAKSQHKAISPEVFHRVMGSSYERGIAVLYKLLVAGQRIGTVVAERLETFGFGLVLDPQTTIECEEGVRYAHKLGDVAANHVLDLLINECDINYQITHNSVAQVEVSWLLRVLASGNSVDLTLAEARAIEDALECEVSPGGYVLKGAHLMLVKRALKRHKLKPIDISKAPYAAVVMLANNDYVTGVSYANLTILRQLGIDVANTTRSHTRASDGTYTIHGCDLYNVRRLVKMLNPAAKGPYKLKAEK